MHNVLIQEEEELRLTTYLKVQDNLGNVQSNISINYPCKNRTMYVGVAAG